MQTPRFQLLRLPELRTIFPYSPTRIYELIKAGLFVPAVRLGGRAVAWPENEVRAITDARIAGQSDAEVKALVAKLVAARRGLNAGAAA